MSKSIRFRNDIYLDSKGIVHRKQLLYNILEKVLYVPTVNNKAWYGTENELTLTTDWYATYLLINHTPYGDYNMYIISFIGPHKVFNVYLIGGNTTASFNIDYDTYLVTITLSKQGYWKSLLLNLGRL